MNNPPYPGRDDFGEIPFVAGALTGRRAFQIKPDKQRDGVSLVGAVQTGWIWHTDRENVAECHKGLGSFHAGMTTGHPGHKVASMDCRCGFYAYAQETPDTLTYRNFFYGGFGVEGVIFGYGRAVAGSLGFRCAKARVLALVVPDTFPEGVDEDEYLDMLAAAQRKYHQVRWYGTFDAAVRDFPLTAAGKYGISHPGEYGQAAS